MPDRKSTRLNSSHGSISYAVSLDRKSTRLNSSQRGIPFSALLVILTQIASVADHVAYFVSEPSTTEIFTVSLLFALFFLTEGHTSELQSLSHLVCRII